MNHRKHRLGLMGSMLIVAALGVMALASSAQAVTAQYVVNGSTALAAGRTITGEQNGIGTLLVPSLNVEVRCTKFTVLEGHISTSTDALGKLLYEECKTFTISPPLEELPCHIVVNNALTGGDYKLHIQATALLLPVHGGGNDFYVLAENIAALVLHLRDTACPLPLDVPITGQVCGLIDGNETVKPLLLFSQAIQEACPGEHFLKYGTNVSYIDASAHVFIAPGDADNGKTLGVLLL